MDVTSLYTTIPHEEGIATVCRAYDEFHRNNPPIPTKYLREMLTLIPKENSFRFNGEDYLQIHGTAMGTKIAVAFANIFMANSESIAKPTAWKGYIDHLKRISESLFHDFLLEVTQNVGWNHFY